MLNFLWIGMILLGIIYGTFTGNLSSLTEAALESAREAVALCITMAGVLAFWSGLMKVAEEAGIMAWLGRSLRPFLHFMFPEIPRNHPANQSIAANCVANFFGLGWAATPAGLQAMRDLRQLQEEKSLGLESGNRSRKEKSLGLEPGNRSRKEKGLEPGDRSRARKSRDGTLWRGSQQKLEVASSEMCTFLVLNISSLQLIPISVIAYRSQYGSPDPSGIIGAGILATGISTAAGIIFAKIMCEVDRRRGYL